MTHLVAPFNSSLPTAVRRCFVLGVGFAAAGGKAHTQHLNGLKFALMGSPFAGNTFQRRDHLALSSLRFASCASSERSEGMTSLKRLRLTRKTSSLKCIALCGCPVNYETGCRCRITCSISGAVFGLPLEYGWL